MGKIVFTNFVLPDCIWRNACINWPEYMTKFVCILNFFFLKKLRFGSRTYPSQTTTQQFLQQQILFLNRVNIGPCIIEWAFYIKRVLHHVLFVALMFLFARENELKPTNGSISSFTVKREAETSRLQIFFFLRLMLFQVKFPSMD